eukprot:789741-Prymnesium_polylepis.1
MQREWSTSLVTPPVTRSSNIEEDAQARADLAAALLDQLAHILAERPGCACVCEHGHFTQLRAPAEAGWRHRTGSAASGAPAAVSAQRAGFPLRFCPHEAHAAAGERTAHTAHAARAAAAQHAAPVRFPLRFCPHAAHAAAERIAVHE